MYFSCATAIISVICCQGQSRAVARIPLWARRKQLPYAALRPSTSFWQLLGSCGAGFSMQLRRAYCFLVMLPEVTVRPWKSRWPGSADKLAGRNSTECQRRCREKQTLAFFRLDHRTQGAIVA